MEIPLYEFEQIIDDKILTRGLSYYREGSVIDFDEISKGLYEAKVLGSEIYDIQLKVVKSTIVEHNCNCPFDYSSVCKHIVAVVFYLLKDEIPVNFIDITKSKKKETAPISKQVNDLLKNISHKDLIDFISNNCKDDKKFRNVFLTSFSHLNQNQSKDFYKKQIHSILQTAAGKDYWIGWSEMKYVLKTTQPILDIAEKSLSDTNFENAFFISCALLEEFTEAFQYGDDSNGDLGYFIESSLDIVSILIAENISSSLKKDIFKYCIKSYKSKVFEGWDWHLEMLNIACKLIDTKSDADIILDCIKNVQGKYEQGKSQLFKLEILRRFKDAEEVEKYIAKHISNPDIRTIEIEGAFNNKNFEKVIKLSKDGINCDKEDKPGLVKDWYNWLLKVAQHQKDIPKTIEYARFLYIDNFYPKQDYYQILKSNVETENWHPFLEEIIKEITQKKRWTYTALIRQIYINEKWWDRLFVLLKENCSLENIKENEKYLSESYSAELVELYSNRIANYVDKYIGRNHYQKACRYLRRVKKLDGNDKVNELILLFKKKYPQRKALMDELTRV
jgi:hypothetical protein